MKHIHEDPEFGALVSITAGHYKISESLVEKDYWVTAALHALMQTKLGVWFKGGTSLSKGFGILPRFSEDLDLVIEPGSELSLPRGINWNSQNRGQVRKRMEYFERISNLLNIPGITNPLEVVQVDSKWMNGSILVHYPGKHVARLPEHAKPFVLLEIGSARITPNLPRDLSSLIHDYLGKLGKLSDYTDNRPRGVRCVHPLVTLVEKLDALQNRYNAKVKPEAFVRHYEDAARVIAAESTLPTLENYESPFELAKEMLDRGQISKIPSSEDPAFSAQIASHKEMMTSNSALDSWYWDKRYSLLDACEKINAWIARALEN